MNALSRIAHSARRSIGSIWTDLGFGTWGGGGTWNYPTSRKTTAGIAVTPQSALTFTAVYSAISVIATDTASLPIGVYQRRADGGRDEVFTHPVRGLLNVTPDEETTAMRFRQALMGHVLGWGNGYSEIEFDRRGYPAKLHLLDVTTTPRRDPEDRSLYYKLANSKRLPPSKVIHIAGLGYDGLRGYSPITMARQAIGLGLAAETFGAALFGNGAIPKGVIQHPKVLKGQALENFRDYVNDMHQGPENAHKFMILEEGATWNPTQINPDDAQFLATRAFQILEIARMYRCPPHKLGDYSQAHLANLEESNLDYLMTTLMPWCEQIEQMLNLRLFTPSERAAGLFVEHNMNAFLRGNMIARGEFYTKLRDLGVLTPNMVARFENLNPCGPEGDVRLVPLNMTSLANAGKPVPTTPPAKAPAGRSMPEAEGSEHAQAA